MYRTVLTSIVLHTFLIALLLVNSLIFSKPKVKPKSNTTIVTFVHRTPVPTQPKPRPTAPKPTPRVTTPAPKKTTPAPVKTTPKPRPTTPKPTPRVTTPAPVKTTPKPVITPPKPVITPPKPAPTPPKPAPTPPKTVVTPPRPPRKVDIQTKEAKLELSEYYMAAARQSIREHFLVLRKGGGLKGVIAILEFTILKNGVIKDVNMVKSTGDSRLDQLALNAMRDTETLMPLPDLPGPGGRALPSLTVQVTFNYGDVEE